MKKLRKISALVLSLIIMLTLFTSAVNADESIPEEISSIITSIAENEGGSQEESSELENSQEESSESASQQDENSQVENSELESSQEESSESENSQENVTPLDLGNPYISAYIGEDGLLYYTIEAEYTRRYNSISTFAFVPGDIVQISNYYMTGYFYNGLTLGGNNFTGNVIVMTAMNADGTSFAYCIEPHVYDPQNVHSNVNTTDSWNALSITQQTLIGYILLASHDTVQAEIWGSGGSNNSPAYMAAQALIWEICAAPAHSGPWVDVSSLSSPTLLDQTYAGNQVVHFLNNNGVMFAYNALKDKVLSMARLPSFTTPLSGTAPLHTMSGNTLVLTDTNNVIQHYTFVNTADFTFSVSGNQLTITKVNPSANINNALIQVANNYNPVNNSNTLGNGSVIYAYRPNMQARTFGVGDPVNAFFRLRSLTEGQVRITKTDVVTGALLPTAVYGVYRTSDDMLMDTLTTNGVGQALSIDMLPGNYYVQEITPPVGYQLDTTQHHLIIVANTITDVSVTDEIITGRITLVKTNIAGNRTLSGAVYGIYRASDNSLIETITSNSNGAIQSSLLPYEPLGYYLQEITPPPRYLVDPTQYPFMINTHLSITPHVVADQHIVGRMVLGNVTQTPTRSVRTGVSTVPYTGVDEHE